MFQEAFLCPSELPSQGSSQLDVNFATAAKFCNTACIQNTSRPCDAGWVGNIHTAVNRTLHPGPQPEAKNCGRKFILETGVSGPFEQEQEGGGGAPENLDKEREAKVGVVSRGRTPERASPGCLGGEENLSLE